MVLVLFPTRVAHAQATARFADAPTVAAPNNASRTNTPSPHAVAPVVTAAPVASAPPRLASVTTDSRVSPTPPGGFTRRLAQSHFERAARYESRGDIAQALREYSETISIDSTLGDAYLRLGALRERMGEAREADLVYSAAVRLADTRARALLQRSHLRRAAGLNGQALSDLETAAELDPNRAVLEELARDYVERQAWSAALAAYRRIAADARESSDANALKNARLEVRALRVLAAETDSTQERPQKHDWVSRALRSIAKR